ncbi:MAG: hypothetical protein JJU05_16660 [Verrucomicrobia bacterium]|nr:hypothetical protein [Verrucomicrobiota bacterium]MCH8526397.1 hypothetical protein [Kiritimatiellia bacterium]
MDALLNPDDILPRLRQGGQEHDVFDHGDRLFKVTKGGYFGLNPGVDIGLEINGIPSKKFKLWEATPLEYLERIYLQNQLTPGLVRLEGVLDLGHELAIVTSQPYYRIVPVQDDEIEAWFAEKGFQRITNSAFYRKSDNLAIFDAHDKNVIRLEETLIPFDVIPCYPDAEMSALIREALEKGLDVQTHRSTHTTSRVLGKEPGE